MAVFHRYAGPCRNPKCNRTVRSNGFTVYCCSCTALDIRYGDPRQRRITQKALTKPLAAVARIRKRNPNADWQLMAENWNVLVRRCQRSARARTPIVSTDARPPTSSSRSLSPYRLMKS